MQDRELYAQILGVREPWRVKRVELKLEAGEAHVRLAGSSDVQIAYAKSSPGAVNRVVRQSGS